MLIIKHRQNFKIDCNNNLISGAEIDVRIHKRELVLSHDPFCDGIKLIDWIKSFNYQLLIINVKEEGLEKSILEIINKSNVKNFFILDETIPFIIRFCNNGFSNFGLRISKWESFESAIKIIKNVIKKPEWIWLDTFDGEIPISINQMENLKEIGMKICLVSPELHPDYKHQVPTKEFLRNFNNFQRGMFNAVCTKKEEFWNYI